MAANTLPSVCIRIILEILSKDVCSLHTCILMNRHWCLISINKLWENPFKYFTNFQKKRRLQFINVYLRCLDPRIKESLNIKFQDNTTFDYIGFLRSVNPDFIKSCITIWMTENVEFPKIIVEVLCEQIIIRSNRLKNLELIGDQTFNIFKLANAERNLSTIKSFKFLFTYNQSETYNEILFDATKISTLIRNIEISYYSHYPLKEEAIQAIPNDCIENIIKLLYNQKRLSSLIIKYLDDFSLSIILMKGLRNNFNNVTKIHLYCIKNIINQQKNHINLLDELQNF